jgi:tryptophanyl-tRNA synthetase
MRTRAGPAGPALRREQTHTPPCDLIVEVDTLTTDQLTESGLTAAEAEAVNASFATARARSVQIEGEIRKDPSRFRVLTGDRPTGALHIGHYFGTLANRVRLQDQGVETMVLIADYQVITDRDSVGPIRERVLDMIADYLAIGIDEARSTIFTHSAIPALNQLVLPFLALVTDAELRRNPTVNPNSPQPATARCPGCC